MTEKLVAAVFPMRTADTPLNPLPLIVTEVPALPLAGLSPVTVGALEVYVKWSAEVGVELPLVVATMISTMPAACVGEVAMMEFPDMTVYDEAAVLPNITDVTFENPLPAIWTEVPPWVVAWLGLTAVTTAVRSWRTSRTSAATVR
jgi:hypothetical protein